MYAKSIIIVKLHHKGPFCNIYVYVYISCMHIIHICVIERGGKGRVIKKLALPSKGIQVIMHFLSTLSRETVTREVSLIYKM